MPPPLLTLADIRLGWGGTPLFEGLSLAVHRGERIALVGRNGSGKSTLLKVMAGLMEADTGERFLQPGARAAYLPQDPDLTGFATLGDYAAADLPPEERYRAEIAMDALEVREAAAPEAASGGERRRAAIARTLAAEPELMLLDEPTNHLDIAAIGWLEKTLAETRSAVVLISHDRAFLTALSRATLWIDRGAARRLDQGFAAFEDWRDKVFEEEETERHKLERQIKREEHWIIHGVSGRRKRNMRRVADLAALREKRKSMTGPQGAAALSLDSGQASGKLVIEARSAAKRWGDRAMFEGFDVKIARGDRVALVGPNGVGKTTLLKTLLGEIAPDEGEVRLGANLTPAVFDQSRAQIDLEKSLWENLTDDKALGVKGANDQVLVRGRPKHVVGYLKEFLFDERQARGPASALSGGERARLLLAKLFAREANLLALDEPTNDLDVETLDLLQEILSDYDGTLLLVSHDRDFIDRVATQTISMAGDGRAVVYAGGWTDHLAQKAAAEAEAGESAPAKSSADAPKPKPQAQAPARAPAAKSKKLSYAQSRRLDALPAEIDRYTDEINKLETLLARPDFFEKEPKKFQQAVNLLADRQAKLAAAEEEWLELESLREALDD